ncbi:MAG: Eco57I restriction-modification methylase domain-containing protein [Flavobacteriia bacterium]|nr:Eco57I restriction-modification methylase domain-containing protein [Flavobacteriia bacterium]
MATSKETAKAGLEKLVARFTEQYDDYKQAKYSEALVRKDFIDPFFKLLGWDMDNSQGFAEAYREVIHEDKVKVGGALKAPDYSFRLPGGKRLFFVEAKKPAVKVKSEVEPAYQVRRYAWSAKLPVSILTDFEEFSVYDCSQRPEVKDSAAKARIKYLTFRDYLREFDFLWDTFSKEQVLKGSFDRFLKSDTHKRGTSTVDAAFLQSLDNWRTYLATSISIRNKHLDQDGINFAVQHLIDRLIFLRIAEDRGVEPYGQLKAVLKETGDHYPKLFALFQQADRRYNSGLFDFRKDQVSEGITVDNKVMKTIIGELYYPESPYEFSVISVEILGSAYEQFLGKQIRIGTGHRAHIEEKPEVRHAGGVYYTPQYIVRYIVERTVGELLKGKKPAQVEQLRILDPACGSGSFLLGAYEYLLDWHKEQYGALKKMRTGRKSDKLRPDGELTTAEKKRILVNNIFGVDLDANAVEVTKLSLLLKCMEGETEASINQQLGLFHDRVLPTLDQNIKCGNSLIGTDWYDLYPDGDPKAVKPFNWRHAFPEVFKVGKGKSSTGQDALKAYLAKAERVLHELNEEGAWILERFGKDNEVSEPVMPFGTSSMGFDVVIGNPPYVRQELFSAHKPYLQQRYKTYHGVADLYTYFMEKGAELLKPGGLYGIIVANKWMRANYGEALRRWLKQQDIRELIDFGDLPVFAGATTYPCIVLYAKDKPGRNINVCEVKHLDFEDLGTYVKQHRRSLPQSGLEDSGWSLASAEEQKLFKKLMGMGVPLGEYVGKQIYYGIKTGYNEAFVIDAATRKALITADRKSAEVIKPFLAGRDIKRYQQPMSEKYLIVLPKGYTNENGQNPKDGWRWLKQTLPAIAEHLAPFKEKAEKRTDKGDYWWELRACDYYADFGDPKIMWAEIALRGQFQLDRSGLFLDTTAFFTPVEDLHLLGMLNSKLFSFLFSKLSSSIRGGYFRWKRIYMEQMPIIVDKKQSAAIAAQVRTLLDLKAQEGTVTGLQASLLADRIAHVDARIDELVYGLYGLTEEEVLIVEKA